MREVHLKQRFELKDESHQKFWEVEQQGAAFSVRFGRIGTEGQTKTKSTAGPEQARLEVDKLIAEKTKKGYSKVSGAGAKPASFADIMNPLEQKLASTVRPYVKLTAKRKKGLSPWASKSADVPYLPIGTPWPKQKKEPLRPFVQIDLAAMPALPGFPRKGLVSFFLSEDGTHHQVLYFPTIERDPRKLQHDFSFIDWEDVHLQSPFGGPAELSFEKKEGVVCWGDYRFEALVGKKELEALLDSPHYDKVYNRVARLSGSDDHRIGGYASPQQDDPRRGKARAYELLLQVEDDSITRCFFIKPSALASADFSDVLYFEASD